jgi:phytoene synthase
VSTARIPAIAGGHDLAPAFDEAARVVRARARNFYWGLRLTPQPRRGAVYAVYAWMRAGDDATDVTDSVKRRRELLGAFTEATGRVLAGERAVATREQPWWPAFADAVRTYGLAGDVVGPMLEGLAEDLSHEGYASCGELESYCRRVAGTAGRACVRIWGVQDRAVLAKALELADVLGCAFQLTNITRDLGEDARNGRVYVPRDLLEKHGLRAFELASWARPGGCEAVVAELVRLALARYEEAGPLTALVSADCRPTLAAMTSIYRGLLDACARSPQRCVAGPRVRLSTLSKLWVVGRTLAIGPRVQGRPAP